LELIVPELVPSLASLANSKEGNLISPERMILDAWTPAFTRRGFLERVRCRARSAHFGAKQRDGI